MRNIQLSILIPSIPSRFDKAYTLYQKLLGMTGDKDIEILMLVDDKKRTIGAKRDNLKNIAQGKYFMFCDDDDEIVSLDEIYEATFLGVDVIDFKAECANPDGSTFIVTQRLGNPVEHRVQNGKYLDCDRPPFPNCAWASRFKNFNFPDISYGEDWGFIKKCLEFAETEHFIDQVLFKYNFSPTGTEASTESNTEWQNPNPVKVISRAVVNVSTQKYRRGQNRLYESLQGKTDAKLLFYNSEDAVDAPPHAENNYAFKPMAVLKAYQQGYRQILWLDASMKAIKNIEPIFKLIEKDGYFFQYSGWLNSRWNTEKSMAYFGTDEGPMLSSGVLGLDLDSEIGYKFFDRWTQAMRDGMFNGSWDDWRHDQSCASLIAFKLGMKIHDEHYYFEYGKETKNDNVVILADGIS